MLDAIYIGNGLERTGFALVGIPALDLPTSREHLLRLIERQRQARDLVILSAECARVIEDDLERLLSATPLPPIVVLPDSGGEAESPAVIRAAYAALGIEDAAG